MSKDKLSRAQLIAATAGVMLALLLAALDQTIVGTALPRIVAELNGLDRYSWLVTGYLVGSTVIIPIAGKLGDLFGRKPFLIVGMIGFVATSALCGQAGLIGSKSDGMTQLIIFRILQGIFGGVLFASAFTVLADIFPPRERARMQGLFGGVFGLASILGPVLGGFLTDHWGWRWVFYVNLPVGLVGVLVVLSSLPFIRSKASWRDIDFFGSAALAGGLIPILIALSIAKDKGWTSSGLTTLLTSARWTAIGVIDLLSIGILMLIAFYLIETRAKEPIVPFELFKNRVFAVSVTVGFLSSLGMFGMIIFVPLELQGVLNMNVTNSGFMLTPMMLGLIVASVIAGNLMIHFKHYRYLGTLGVGLMMTGMYMMAQTTTSTHQVNVIADILIIGFGLGLTFPLYLNAVQSALPPRFLGVGSSQIQFWRNVGGTISSAVLGSVLAQRLPETINQNLSHLSLSRQQTAMLAGQRQLLGGAGANPNQLFDPKALAAIHSRMPGPAWDLFQEKVLPALRDALASTLHDIFLVAVGMGAIALVVTVFLKEVPLKGRGPAASSEGAEESLPPMAAEIA